MTIRAARREFGCDAISTLAEGATTTKPQESLRCCARHPLPEAERQLSIVNERNFELVNVCPTGHASLIAEKIDNHSIDDLRLLKLGSVTAPRQHSELEI